MSGNIAFVNMFRFVNEQKKTKYGKKAYSCVHNATAAGETAPRDQIAEEI